MDTFNLDGFVEKKTLFKRFRKIYQVYGKELDANSKAEQVSFIEEMDKIHLKSGPRRLLDIGCGEGILLDMLKGKYRCNGIDTNKKIISHAIRTIKGATFAVFDIKDFNSPERFDIITAIDFIHGSDRKKSLEEILSHIHKHLESGGLLIFSVPICRDIWINDTTNVVMLDVKDKKWIWIIHNYIKGRSFILRKEVLLIKGSKIEYESEVKTVKFKQGLLGVDNILKIADEMGFKTSVYTGFTKERWYKDCKGEPVFVCVKS